MMMMKTSMMYLMVWRAMISQDWQVFFRPALMSWGDVKLCGWDTMMRMMLG